jgi:cytochrome c553
MTKEEFVFDVVGVSLLLGLVALCAWLSWRTWRSPRPWLKWPGALVAGLLALLATLATTLALAGFYRLNARHPNPVADVTVAGTPEQIARGKQLAHVCAGCHAPNGQLPLAGKNFTADSPLGTIYAANLTPVHLQDWSDGEIIRAIREGVSKSGRALLIMPSKRFQQLSDDDVQAIVAYLRSQPAVAPDTPPPQLNAAGAILLNIIPAFSVQPPLAAPVHAPPQGTPAYGQYLIRFIGCADCHGAGLAGGVADSFGPLPGPPLTSLAARWGEAEFIVAMRTGTRPGGTQLGDAMPWRTISATTSDDDLRAIYAYLRTLTP